MTLLLLLLLLLLLQIIQQMQGAGVTHRALSAASVVLLAGDVPAIVSFDMAVAQGMAFPIPVLPPHLADIYQRPTVADAPAAARARARRANGAGAGAEDARRSGGRVAGELAEHGGYAVEGGLEGEVEGEVMRGESDIYALGLLLSSTLPVAADKFAPVLDVMLQRWRPERITHVQVRVIGRGGEREKGGQCW